MQAINNQDILDYAADQNILAASLSFEYTGGSGYTSAPSVSFSGGAGTGAAGTAVIANGRVTGITITAGGSGYTSAPTIAFTGGGGTGAAATAVLTADAVTSATITSGGTGKTLAVTDNTAYGTDSRKAVNISVFDKFGNSQQAHIGVTPGNVTIDLLAGSLNDVNGLDVLATVVSAAGKNKDGEAIDVGTLKTTGNFVMNH